jgi:hypothetical protein
LKIRSLPEGYLLHALGEGGDAVSKAGGGVCGALSIGSVSTHVLHDINARRKISTTEDIPLSRVLCMLTIFNCEGSVKSILRFSCFSSNNVKFDLCSLKAGVPSPSPDVLCGFPCW